METNENYRDEQEAIASQARTSSSSEQQGNYWSNTCTRRIIPCNEKYRYFPRFY